MNDSKVVYKVKTRNKVLVGGKYKHIEKIIDESFIDDVLKTGKYEFRVYPDNDSYNYYKKFDVELTKKTTNITIEKLN